MTSVRRLLGALACLASAAVPCAHAASSSASITNLKIQVIDLTPGDNNTAGYAFVESSSMNSVAYLIVQGGPSESEEAFGYLAPVSASATAFGSSGQSRVDATGLYSQAATTERASVSANAAWSASRPAFTIAPYTELIITAHYVDRVSIDHLGCDPSCVISSANGSMFSTGSGGHSILHQGAFLYSGGATDLTQTVEGDFTIYVANNTINTTVDQQLILHADVNMQFPAAPVAEPSEMVLMLLGMGAVGAMVWRRRGARHGQNAVRPGKENRFPYT
jgi:hypothetical protein